MLWSREIPCHLYGVYLNCILFSCTDDVMGFTVSSTLWNREMPCHLYSVYKANLYLIFLAGDVLRLTVPSTLWSRETPCHLYSVCKANLYLIFLCRRRAELHCSLHAVEP